MTAKKKLFLSIILAGTTISFSFLLQVIATPSAFRDRIANIDRQYAATDTFTLRQETAPNPPMCATDLDPTAADLSERFRVRLVEHDLTIVRLDAVSSGEMDRGAFTAVDVQFEAYGSYERAVDLLEYLAVSAPMLAADSLDLVTEGPQVKLVFSGRVHCAS